MATVDDMSQSSEKPSNSMRRREFLANLLFAGGLLSVGGLQAQYPLVARKDPEKEGWQLPKDWKKKNEEDGWQIPDDLMQPEEPPSPQPPSPQPPSKPPEPRPNGGLRPPVTPGRYAPPKPLPGKPEPHRSSPRN